MTKLQRIIKYAATALAFFIIACIVAGIFSVLGIASGVFSGNNVLDEMKTYSFSSSVTKVEMEIDAADVSIVHGDEFKLESNLKKISVKEKNGVLKIEDESATWFSFGDDGKVVLYIPDDIEFDDFELSTGAGALNIDSCIKTENLDLELGAGKASIKYIYVSEKAEIEGGAGKLSIVGCSFNNLDLEMGVGELEIVADIKAQSKFDLGVGKARIEISENKSDYKIHIDKGIGSVTVDSESVSDDSIIGDGNIPITINGGVGTITVVFSGESQE